MKYVILIGDGMADYPSPEHEGKTALELAQTPNLDFIATSGICGLVRTIPEGLGAGSDIATLSILGYDPARYHTGRGPIEALGMHVPLDEGDIAFRCNLITEEGGRIEDYSGGHISNEEAKELIAALNEEFRSTWNDEGWKITFYPGVSYRNILVLKSQSNEFNLVDLEGGAPPHDVIGARIEENLPKEGLLRDLMLASKELLEKHVINKRRAAHNVRQANMVWLWSGGRKPIMPRFSDLYGVNGSVISGVDLIRGIGRCVGLDVLDVPGATGYLDTNYEGKADCALRSLKEHDFILVHVEAPDEAGHLGDLALKVKAIEDFDARVVGTVLRGLERDFADGGYRILAMPDHYTPVSVQTHTKEPVPFALYHSHAPDKRGGKKGGFNETSARNSDLGILDARAQELMRLFFSEKA